MNPFSVMAPRGPGSSLLVMALAEWMTAFLRLKLTIAVALSTSAPAPRARGSRCSMLICAGETARVIPRRSQARASESKDPAPIACKCRD